LNPFFTLEKEATPSWAQRAKQKIPTQVQLQPEQTQASDHDDLLANRQSPNLLAQFTESEDVEDDSKTADKDRELHTEVAALRAMIVEMQTWMTNQTKQITHIGHEATMAHDALQQTDIHELSDQLHRLRDNVMHKETYDRNRVRMDKELEEARQRINQRMDTIESATAINRLDYQDKIAALQMHTDATLATIETSMVLHHDELQTAIKERMSAPSNRQALKAIEDKQEAVTEALDLLYNSICDDLLTETKETIIADLDFEFKQDPSIKNRITKITKDLLTDETLADARTKAMETQLTEIKTYAKTQMEQHLAGVLEPTARSRNPYNPVDRALKTIQSEITDMVHHAIKEIDTVIQGTVDQAIEDVRLSTRSTRTTPATAPIPTQPPVMQQEAIPTITPERTFRGRTVRIDEPPPRQDQYPQKRDDPHDSYNSRHQAQDHTHGRGHYDDYDRSRDEYRKQRDQESFLKGHVEASLESLKEDDMIVWYKSFDSYCSLHNIPLLTFHQVTKGRDLYPSTHPAAERPRFSRIISLKLNQLHLIKDPTAKSIKNARVGRDDGYGALYALLAATIPRLQVNQIAPKTGSNKPPEWDPSTMNLYHFESKIQDYVEFQANKGRQYNDREETLFFLEGLSTDESQRFKSALTNIMYNLDKTPENQNLPMDYRLGQIAQTVAELAQSDTDVGQDALTILGAPHINAVHDTPISHYSCDARDGKPDARPNPDRRYDRDNHRGGRGGQRKPRRPKMEVQCYCCKLYGHEETHCDHLAKTMFVVDYAKKHEEKTAKVCEAFNKKNSKETQALIRHLKAMPNRHLVPPPAPVPIAHEYYDEEEDDDDDHFEEMLGNMLGSYGSSINSATAPAPESEHNKSLLRSIDPMAMQTVNLPPMPTTAPPLLEHEETDTKVETTTTETIPIVCHIQNRATTAQADSGANRAITDNPTILHNSRQMATPYPVGSIDAENKLYCTAVGEIHLKTLEGTVEKFQCLYSAQSAGTVISPDNKCTTSPHLTKWEQVGDTKTGQGFIRFRNDRDDIVASLPTYRQNGLWFTQLAAIPADPAKITTIKAPSVPPDIARINALQAPPETASPDMAMALTDSDRHYLDPTTMGGCAYHIKTIVETVEDDEDNLDEDIDADAEELFPATYETTPQDAHDAASHPYPDPHIPPPEEPPPKVQRTRDPHARHADDDTTKLRNPRNPRLPKQVGRDWQGASPPVPKQKPPQGGQLQTELWHQRMAHPGTAKLKKTQQHTTGMPPLGAAHPLFGCNNCNMAKMDKQPRGKTDSREAKANGKRFHMDYGFFRGPRHLQKQLKRKYGNMTIASLKHKPIIES
jgi:hypothetical protein